MTDVNSMVAVAEQWGQHTIAKMLENAYRDDCNYSVTTGEELKEIKEELPGFMHKHGFPNKALVCTGEKAQITDLQTQPICYKNLSCGADSDW